VDQAPWNFSLLVWDLPSRCGIRNHQRAQFQIEAALRETPDPTIPFPQRDLHLRPGSCSSAASETERSLREQASARSAKPPQRSPSKAAEPMDCRGQHALIDRIPDLN